MGIRKHWRGGAYQRGALTAIAADDGHFEFDHNGVDYTESNWINDAGVGVVKPESTDELVYSELATIVAADYSNLTYPHIAGKRFCCCEGLDQSVFNINTLTVAKGYDGGIHGYVVKTLDAADAGGSGDSTIINILNHGTVIAAVGAYVTIVGSVHHSGEFRITAAVENVSITIDHPYIAELFTTQMTATIKRPLEIGITAAHKIEVTADCTIYIEASHATLEVEELVFDSTSGLLHLSCDGTRNWNNIIVAQAGTLRIAKDTHFTKLNIYAAAINATVIVGAGCHGPAAVSCDLDIDAGNLIWDSALGDILANGGIVTYCQNIAITVAVNIDDLQMHGNCILNWYGKSILTTFEQRNGKIIALGAGDKMIGSDAVEYLQTGGIFDLSQATGRTEIYTGAAVKHDGGDFKVAKRSSLSW